MTMPLITHYDEEYLESYAMGRLPDEPAAEIEEHLLLCEQCQQRLERVDDFIRAFRIASNQSVSCVVRPAVSQGWFAEWFGVTLRPLPVAGALAVAALGVVMIAPRNAGQQGVLPLGQTPQIASLSAMRGAPETGLVAAYAPLQLDLDASGLDLPSYRVELADSRGRQIWQASLAVSSGRIPAALPKRLSAGAYWVRLYDPDSGQLVREFGLRAQ